MNLTYFDTTGVEHLVEEFFELFFDENSVPFQSTILPLGLASMNYNFEHKHIAVIGTTKIPLSGIMLTGQFNSPYEWVVGKKGRSFGMSFHPTALYKLFNTDISRFENKHIPLKDANKVFYDKIHPILEAYENPETTIKKISEIIKEISLTVNKNTDLIDNAIELIRLKEGLLSIEDILNKIKISQKSLEIQFKKIVGLTPGKYVRLYRFLKLMRSYEEKKISLQDLIHMYNYYDRSHFSKDFKLFMNKTPKSHFSKDYPLIKEILKK